MVKPVMFEINMFCFSFILLCLGRSWSENGNDSTALEPVCGGSLATEGVRTALAQLLNFHGIIVNGLEKTIGHHQTQSNGGKWF